MGYVNPTAVEVLEGLFHLMFRRFLLLRRALVGPVIDGLTRNKGIYTDTHPG